MEDVGEGAEDEEDDPPGDGKDEIVGEAKGVAYNVDGLKSLGDTVGLLDVEEFWKYEE